MKKLFVFGLIAAGAAVAAAAIYKSRKNQDYICDEDCCDDDCFCDDCCEECGDICEIPAENADESCIASTDERTDNNEKTSESDKTADDDDSPIGI